MTTTNLRFVTKNGLDNNSNSITNLGVTGASLTLSGANALTFTTTGATNITLPTGGTLVTTTVGNIAGSAATAGTVTTAAQPNITSVGTLTSLAVTGAITTGGVEVGTKIVQQNIQSAAYTLVLADSGKHILPPSADTTARIFTIPANSSVAFPIGTEITFVNQASAGVVTIAITTDTMYLAGAGTTGSIPLAASNVATALKITATVWIVTMSSASSSVNASTDAAVSYALAF